MSALIPMPADVRSVIGEAAEHVEHHGLLLDKLAVPKRWIGIDKKVDDAARWSFQRVSAKGEYFMQKELDKARWEQRKQKDSKQGEIVDIKVAFLPKVSRTAKLPSDFTQLRRRHSETLRNLLQASAPDTSRTFTARLESPLAINLSDGLIENAGIALDRTFGLPCIPGSALKGCARHVALAELAAADSTTQGQLLKRFLAVFGSSSNDFNARDARKNLLRFCQSDSPAQGDCKGGVNFLTANLLEGGSIEVDLTNVHTPAYYTGDSKLTAGTNEALKIERLIPNNFPVVQAGSRFSICITLNSIGLRADDPQSVLEDAQRWLTAALTETGIGAKTGAGYGWFSIDTDYDQQAEQAAADRAAAEAEAQKKAKQAEAERQAEEARLAALPPEQAEMEKILKLDDPDFAALALTLADKSETEQKGFLLALLSETKKDKWKRWKKSKKANDAERVRQLQTLADNLKIKLP